jgi:C-terminal domain of alpha-glycerophosphate oxidase
VPAPFEVDEDGFATSRGERFEPLVRVLDHEMGLERHRGVRPASGRACSPSSAASTPLPANGQGRRGRRRPLDGRVNARIGHGDDPLLGARGWEVLWNQRERLAKKHGLQVEQVDHLFGRYGLLIGELFDLLGDRPELARPIDGAPEYLEAETIYAASHEGALHLDDVLVRRTHIAIETRDRGLGAAERAAALVGEVLGWDDARRAQEVARYRAQMDADRRAEREPDDDAAVAARRPILSGGAP